MEHDESEFQCSDCGTNITSDAKICPNCGASFEELPEEENFVEIPISSEPSTIATIQSLLQENNIEYSINDNALENVFGSSFNQFPRLIIPKDQAQLVNDIIDSFEQENVEILDIEDFKEDDGEKEEPPVALIGVKGWLLFFCISLIFIGPMISLPLIFLYLVNNNPFNYYPLPSLILDIDIIVSTLILLSGIYVGITIWILRPNSIRYANIFLNVYLGYTILSFLIIFILVPSNDISYNSETLEFFSDTFRETIYSIGYVIVWRLYLKKSERVKNTFNIK